MTQTPLRLALATIICLPCVAPAFAADDTSHVDTSRGDALITEYFRLETRKIADATLADIHSLEDWEANKGEYRRQLFEMLGLDPLPARTPLQPVITGTVEHEEFTVETLHFQSRPGLYVTGNLYLPKGLAAPAPTILYVCGHARVKEDGISYGNKVAYQHHGAWFARHGYVCLTIDTLQLGEIEGIHHGTYREGMWWWISRGYTSAGVEAWNCIRALDYLETRPEVDASRLGVTGRSGGGAYSWWVAALDDRIKVAVPVAGITSLKNHVVDGCVEGHCDCMYMLNTYRWDFPLVAALVAPRPLLISNTDKDRIFPLDGVYDVYTKTRRIYDLYGATDRVGLHICEGPHQDTQQLRVHAFQWMNKWLKGEEPLIEKAAVKFFEPQQLRVFDELPEDQINTEIHETFVAQPQEFPIPQSPDEWQQMRDEWMTALKQKVFRGWPQGDDVPPLDVKEVFSEVSDGVRLTAYEFTSQEPYHLRMYVMQSESGRSSGVATMNLKLFNQEGWESMARVWKAGFPNRFETPHVDGTDRGGWKTLVDLLTNPKDEASLYIEPRGIGSTEWTRDERKRTHIERRFALLGQTSAGTRVWDVRRGIQAARSLPELSSTRLRIYASGEAGVWALYAPLFEPDISSLTLSDFSANHRDHPPLMNVLRYLNVPQAVALGIERSRITLDGPVSSEWDYPQSVAGQLGWQQNFRLRNTTP